MHRLSLLAIVVVTATSCSSDTVMIRDRVSTCGNGEVETGENCDDGNTDNNDGCTNGCETSHCGDGILRQDMDADDPLFEECDDGNADDTDSCLTNCRPAYCGDGS